MLRAVDSEGFNGLESHLPVCIIDPLPAPTGLHLEELKDSVEQFRVTWDAPAGAETFLVEVATDADFTGITSSVLMASSDALVSAGGADTFFVRVTAIDKDNNYGVSSTAIEHNASGFLMIVLSAAAAVLLAVALL